MFDKVNLKHIKEPEPVFADISKGDGGRSVMSAIFKGVASALTAPCKCQQQSEAQCPNLRLQGLTLILTTTIKPRLSSNLIRSLYVVRRI